MLHPSLRLCAIDIGSNAIRMRIVEVTPTANTLAPTPTTLTEHRYPIRLGDSFAFGHIPPPTLEAATSAFLQIASHCREHHVQHLRAVATSAMREAANSQDLIDAIQLQTGILIEVITGQHEGELLARGVHSALLPGRPNLIIDVGGGSTELVFVPPDQSPTAVHSLPLGAVRLSQPPAPNSPPNPESLRAHIAETLLYANLPPLPADTHTIGVAGTIRALVKATNHNRPTPDTTLTRQHLSTLIPLLATHSPAHLNDSLGIDPTRADIVLPGALIVLAVLDHFNLPGLTFSKLGVRDGIIHQLIESATSPGTPTTLGPGIAPPP